MRCIFQNNPSSQAAAYTAVSCFPPSLSENLHPASAQNRKPPILTTITSNSHDPCPMSCNERKRCRVVDVIKISTFTHLSVWRQYESVAAVGGAGRRLQLRGDVCWPARPRSLSYPQPVLECELMVYVQQVCSEPSPSPRPRTRNG